MKKISCRPDLILLDINMPGLNGLEVCARIRAHVSCPILFLTARIERSDKIVGFQAGGDDYIVKPFDMEGRTVSIRGEAVKLSKREFDIVELLSMHQGQVFDRERIYEIVWGMDGDGSSGTVIEHIRKVRAKLSAKTLHNYIETVWGVGYRWNG